MPTKKRPLSVTVAGYILLATGIVGSAVHAGELRGVRPVQQDVVWALVTSLVAVLCGIYLLRRSNWARWLAVAWLAFHVVLSIHSQPALLVHTLLLALFGYLLFRPAARAYFRPATSAES